MIDAAKLAAGRRRGATLDLVDAQHIWCGRGRWLKLLTGGDDAEDVAHIDATALHHARRHGQRHAAIGAHQFVEQRRQIPGVEGCAVEYLIGLAEINGLLQVGRHGRQHGWRERPISIIDDVFRVARRVVASDRGGREVGPTAEAQCGPRLDGDGAWWASLLTQQTRLALQIEWRRLSILLDKLNQAATARRQLAFFIGIESGDFWPGYVTQGQAQTLKYSAHRSLLFLAANLQTLLFDLLAQLKNALNQ